MGMLDKVAGAAIPAEMTDMLASSVRNMETMTERLARVVDLLEQLVEIQGGQELQQRRSA